MGSWGPVPQVFSVQHVMAMISRRFLGWLGKCYGYPGYMGHHGLSEVNILGKKKLDRKIIEFERKSAAKSIGVFNPQIVGRFQAENLQDGET